MWARFVFVYYACGDVQLWECIDNRPTWVLVKTIADAHSDRISSLVCSAR
jgi:hypothetical protein